MEVFTGPDEEGKTYLATTLADGSGNTSDFSAQAVGGKSLLFLPVTMKRY